MFRLLLPVLFAFVLMVAVSAKVFSQDEFNIIGNQINSESEISRYDLYLIFTLQNTRWSNGTPIKLVIFNPESDHHRRFITNYLGISTNYYNRILRKAKGDYRIVNNVDDLIAEVESDVGSISYTNNIVYLNDKSSVKVFKVLR